MEVRQELTFGQKFVEKKVTHMMIIMSILEIFMIVSMIGLILPPEKFTIAVNLTSSKIRFIFLFSYIVMTTSGGIMDHEEARRKHLGGKILGFFF